MHMKNLQRRLHKLEQMPQFQPPPSLLKQIENLALAQICYEHLVLLDILGTDLKAGVERVVSESELEAVAAQNAALEAAARQMGFKSYAQAERRGGRR
jgi:hypothetical protein